MCKFCTSASALPSLLHTFAVCRQEQLIQVRLSLSPSLDMDEDIFFQLLDIGIGTPQTDTHIFCQPILTRKAEVILPCIFEKHRICQFCSWRNVVTLQNVIWYLRKSLLRKGISACENDIFLLDDF